VATESKSGSQRAAAAAASPPRREDRHGAEERALQRREGVETTDEGVAYPTTQAPPPKQETVDKVTYRDPRPLDWPQKADRSVFIGPCAPPTPTTTARRRATCTPARSARTRSSSRRHRGRGRAGRRRRRHLNLIINGETINLGGLGGSIRRTSPRASRRTPTADADRHRTAGRRLRPCVDPRCPGYEQRPVQVLRRVVAFTYQELGGDGGSRRPPSSARPSASCRPTRRASTAASRHSPTTSAPSTRPCRARTRSSCWPSTSRRRSATCSSATLKTDPRTSAELKACSPRCAPRTRADGGDEDGAAAPPGGRPPKDAGGE
jgi:hypothetical protein